MHVECCAMRMRRGVGVRSTCPSARFFFPREKEAVKTATVECKVGYNCTIECKVGIRNIITPFTVRTTISLSQPTACEHTVRSQHDAQDAYRCYRRPQAQHNARGRRRARQLERARSSRAPPPRCRRLPCAVSSERRLERAVAALPLLRESARIKGDKAGVRKQRPHATVASPPSVRRPRQRAPPAAAAAAAAYGIHPPEPAQHMRRRHRTCVHRRARWRAAPAGNAKTHSTPPSHHDDGVEHK